MTQKKEKYLANGNDKEKTGQTFDNPAYVDMTGAKNVQINNPTYSENHYVAIETNKGVPQKYKIAIVIIMILLLAAAIAGVVVYFMLVAKPTGPLTDKNTVEDSSAKVVLEGVDIATMKSPGDVYIKEKSTTPGVDEGTLTRHVEVTGLDWSDVRSPGPYLETIPTRSHGLVTTPHAVSGDGYHDDNQSVAPGQDFESETSRGETISSTRTTIHRREQVRTTVSGARTSTGNRRVDSSPTLPDSKTDLQQRSTTGSLPESNLQSQASPVEPKSHSLSSTHGFIELLLATNAATTIKREVSLPSAVSDRTATTVPLSENNVQPSAMTKSAVSKTITRHITSSTQTDPVPGVTQCKMNRVLDESEVWDVVTPFYPSNYDNDQQCQWNVSSSTGRIDVFFMDLHVEEIHDKINMYAETDDGNLISVFADISGSQIPGNITIPHGKVILTFTSDGEATEQGLWVRFKAELLDALPINATATTVPNDSCVRHYEIHRDQVIQFESPNYPSFYTSNLQCLWTIRTTDQSHIRIRFLSFETEQSYDFLSIGTGNVPDSVNRLHRFSGNVLPNDMSIPSTNVWINFSSDGFQEYGGFRGEVAAIDPVPTSVYSTTAFTECEENYFLEVGRTVSVTSPNYPRNYDDLLNCLWLFSTQDDAKLLISFVTFDTEAIYDYIQIGEGTGPRTGTIVLERHHGNEIPPDYTSTTSKLWLKFYTDLSMSMTGFEFTVTAISDEERRNASTIPLLPDVDDVTQTPAPICVENFNLRADDKMTLTTPNFPGHYDSDLNCLWTFSVPDDVMIRIVFDSFETEVEFDYMEAGFGLRPTAESKLIERHSGDSIPAPIIGTPNVWISFSSDDSIARKGFKITISAYQAITSKAPSSSNHLSTSTPSTAQCNREYNLTAGDSVHLTSPNYPNNYPNNVDCLWEFTAADGAQLQVHFISFETESSQDVLEAGEGLGRISGTVILERQSGLHLPDDFISESNMVWISFHSDDSFPHKGFAITVTAVKREIPTTLPPSPQLTTNAPSTTAQGCQRTFYLEEGDSVTVTTPNYPNAYDNMLECLWVFIASDQSALEVSFQSFSTELSYDFMEAGEGHNNLDGQAIIRQHSGDATPDEFVAMSSSAWISFFSDVSVNDSGFEARVTAIQLQPGNRR